MTKKPFKRTRGTTFRGRSNVPLSEVANELCLSYSTVYNRVVYKHETGDDIERGHVMHDKTRRTTIFRGKRGVPIKEVAEALGIPYNRVFQRCAVGGATGDDLEREFKDGYRDPRSPLVTIDGVTKSRAEWQREFRIDKMTVSSRIGKLGWPIERALTEPVDKKKRPTSKLEKEQEPQP